MSANVNGYPWWVGLLVALAGGGLAQLLSVLVNYLTKKKSINVTDEWKFRQDLMKDNTDLRDEIKKLKSRCDSLELDRNNLREDIIIIQNSTLEKELEMEYEIKTLKIKVEDLQEELKIYKGK